MQRCNKSLAVHVCGRHATIECGDSAAMPSGLHVGSCGTVDKPLNHIVQPISTRHLEAALLPFMQCLTILLVNRCPCDCNVGT